MRRIASRPQRVRYWILRHACSSELRRMRLLRDVENGLAAVLVNPRAKLRVVK